MDIRCCGYSPRKMLVDPGSGWKLMAAMSGIDSQEMCSVEGIMVAEGLWRMKKLLVGSILRLLANYDAKGRWLIFVATEMSQMLLNGSE
jgi:hypothetical protein